MGIMAKTIARNALYALVWEEPLRTLAARFDVSDVALRKACQRAAIPTPERGYWAKLQAGKPAVKAALPLRPPGLSHEVAFGDHRHWYRSWTREELLGPIPPPPEFDEDLEAVRARIEAGLGKVLCPVKNVRWHVAIQRLLRQDELRKEKVATSAFAFAWDQPLFESALEQRRLRILNSLFLAVGKFGGKASIRGRDARDICITFDRQHVGISLELAKSTSKPGGPQMADRLCLSILRSVSSSETRATWTDSGQDRLEHQLTKVASEVALTAEIQLREGATRLHQWRIERKTQIEEEDRKKHIEQLRLEQERLEKLEQARVDSLLEAADAFRRAQEIREYVERLGTRLDPTDPTRRAQYSEWSVWALAQADRIDPALKTTFAGERDLETGHE
jgi:hypothetical protein